MKDEQLVAEFMGLTPSSIEGRFWTRVTEERIGFGDLVHLHYKTSWDWLMEVVEKIKQVGKEELKFSIEFELAILTINKETIYNACLDFIEWYNESK
jgi:hypothetical protein